MAFLEARGISKRYGTVIANSNVSFSAEKGELTALLGENGAGKTTLARIISGDESPDSGTLSLGGRKVYPGTRYGPKASRGAGRDIGLVHQHPRLVEDLTVSENIALGAEPLIGLLFLDRKAMLMRTVEAARYFGFSINPDTLVKDLSQAERQEAEILRVLSRGSEAIILDEPTSLLAKAEAESLYGLLDRLVKAGKAVIVVTHRLSEVARRADRFVFLREGKNSGECATFDQDTAYKAMFGAGIGVKTMTRKNDATVQAVPQKKVLLSARDLGRERMSFDAASGEILAFMALAGNGLEELEHLLSGKRPSPHGALLLSENDIGALTIGQRRERGFSYLPSDRFRSGLNRKASVAENILALEGAKVFRFPGKSKRALALLAESKEKVLSYKGDFSKAAGTLSGGQMQALIIDREISQGKTCFLACQPTWGLDRVARGKAHQALLEARNRGACVILLSSEIEEALEIADRIIVLYRGRISCEAENRRDEGLEDRIARAMIGVKS
jgi:ABC-type uncharacterized transport system ATPase subunit